MLNFYILTLLFLSFASYFFGKKTIQKKTTVNQVPQHSRDTYHGFYLALYLLIPSAILILFWVMISPNIIHSLLEQKIQNTILLEDNSQIGVLRSQVISISEGIITTDNQDIQSLVGYYNDISQLSVNLILVVSSISSLFLFFYAYRKINTRFNARTKVENIIKNTMIVASLVAILTTIGIVLSLIIETIEFFKIIKVSDFLFGLQWSPQIALREDQVANEGLFGAIPLFLGTILITIIAMCVAVPIGLLSAIYLSEYSNPRIRAIAKPMLEILAGIPTVVYGFFAALTVAPFLRDNGATLGLSLSSESA
ncbi:MAG: phosphate ABC transporter permease family protein, partial [Hyphomicrobiales bacterium]